MANLKDINYGIGKYLEASDASDIPDIGTNRKNVDLLNFKVATNNAYALYNFKDGMIDVYMSEAGVDASASTDEIYDSVGKYYSGFASVTETYDAYINGYCASSGASGGHIPSFSGTNNRRCTFGGGTGSSSFISANVSGANSGIFTLEMTIVQKGGGNGPSCFGPGVVKDTCSSTAGWPPTSAYGAYNFNSATAVGDVLKLVYDTSDPNVMTTYKNSGSAGTTIDEAGSNWLSIGTPTTLYFLFPCWSDNATPWIWDLAGTRQYTVYNDMTLISNAQTAASQPNEGRLMIYEETSTGSTTLDTDLKGYISRDGGTTYTQTLLALDSNITHPTSLLLHCDGSNDGTTFTDSSFWAHTPTVAGNTHTDTAVKKLGTASAQFDGTGDYLDYASSPAFGFGTGDWTIDFWIYASASGFGTFAIPFDMRSGAASVGSPFLFFDTGNSNIPGFTDGSGTTRCSSNVALSNETWYHIAVVKSSNVTKVYTNGVTGASGTYATEFADTVDYKTTNPLRLGHTTSGSYALNGYLDEFRITKGIARWTANFTPDTSPYTGTEGDTRLVSGSVDISGQPAGTSMRYKIETLNQSDSKVCRIHGASMLWA